MSDSTEFPKTSRSKQFVSSSQSSANLALIKQRRSCTQGPFTRKSRVNHNMTKTNPGKLHICPNPFFAIPVWIRVLLNYIILMCCFRFGEAQNPGPFEGSEPLIGTFNPSGLLGKGQSAVSLPDGAWGVTETHLSAQGLIQFRDELKYLRSVSRFLAGAPAPPLSNSLSCIGGKATGVGLLSSFPCRTLPCTWPKHLQETARIHAGAFCCDNNWIRIGTFYGYAKAPKSVVTQNKSDELLELLTDRIVHDSRGFRAICGDFNQDIRALTQTEEWSRLGFVEIQEYAWLKWGRPVQPTSKGQNVRDYIWISPELIPWIKSVHVDDTWFADHAVLYAKFHPFGKTPPVPIWKKPCPIPWEECEVGDSQDLDKVFVAKASQGSADQRLETIMEFVEHSADVSLRNKGKPGLLRNQRGRASTKEVSRSKFPTVPLKIDRGKVCDPTFTGEHFQHYLWLRQLRRLNSCVRIISTGLTNNTKIDHAVSLWDSVKRAQGFPKGFKRWWPTRSIVWADSPKDIPDSLPSKFQIDLIFQNYKAEFQHLEQVLKTHRVRQAREARLKDPSRVYRDIARPQAVPVQTLVSQISTIIESSSSDHLTLTYPKGALDAGEPVYGPQGIVRTSSHSPGHIELVEDQGLGVGDLLTQPRMCGTIASVFAEFEKHWGTIWNKHSSIPESQWHPFIDKALAILPIPTKPCIVEPITVEEWTSAVRHKKVHSATGPDGIARTDLLYMPHQCKVQLVQLINDIEEGLAWPSQLQVGLVSALEKRDSAQTVADYRPICILSFVYRVWSSIRTKQILKWLDLITPDSLIGSRPHKEAAHVWFHRASIVEDISYDNQTIAGLSVDIQRCFNELPRIPVFAIATALQLPSRVRIPWQKGLIQLERRFVVSGATGPPIRSNSGFTEGDPLSVVAMYLVNLVMTASIAQDCPKVIPWSYVDDWQFTASTAEDTLEGFRKVKEFTDSLQVQLDLKKCFVWGTTAESRASLRTSDLPVKLHARNLGGHLAYSKVSTNYTIVDRIRGCGFFWKKLKRSLASTTQKTLALQVAAWPKCLHGIAGVFLKDAWFDSLRSKAVQALGFDRPGTSPHLQLSGLLTPKADPEYHAIAITIKSFRRFCVPDNAFPMLGYLTQVSPIRFLPGPCGIFLMRIFALGWQWLSDGWISDHKGFVFHLLKTPIQLLESRITDAWLHRVASIVAVREGFAGFEHCDFAISTERYSHIESEHQGLLRTVMNGSFFTRNKQLASGNFVDSTCPWCDQEDSINHRHWECGFFQDCRNSIPQEVFAQLDALDPCTIEHGWFKTPEAFAEFQHLLSQTQDLSHTFVSVDSLGDNVHLFTDGSCLAPESPTLRLASWGVVSAQFDEETPHFHPVAQGPLPGLLQTIFRAEAYAALAAIRYGNLTGKPYWIWVDNQLVFDILKGCLIRHPVPIQNQDKDHDLRQQLVDEAFNAINIGHWQDIIKVVSHQDRLLISSLVEDWAIQGNDAADRCAARGRHFFPPGTLEVWEYLMDQRTKTRHLRDALHGHFIKVGAKAVSCKKELRSQEAKRWAVVDNVGSATNIGDVENDDTPTVPMSVLVTDPTTAVFPACMGGMAHDIYSWLWKTIHAPEGIESWISSHQLLLIYQQTTNQIGVYKDRTMGVWHNLQHSGEDDFDFCRAATDFSSYVRAIVKISGGRIHTSKRRPSGVSYRRWLCCYHFNIPAALIHAIDRQLEMLRVSPILYVQKAFRGFGGFSHRSQGVGTTP